MYRRPIVCVLKLKYGHAKSGLVDGLDLATQIKMHAWNAHFIRGRISESQCVTYCGIHTQPYRLVFLGWC